MSTSGNIFRRHPLNVSYLVVGLVFLGLAGSWALREVGVIDLAEVRWLFPLTLVVAGVIGIVAMTAKGLSTRQDDSDQVSPYASYDTGSRVAAGYDGPHDTSPDNSPDYHTTEGESR